MAGLIHSAKYKVKHVFAPGSDPLSRGWTRGGEIYVWVPREKQKRGSSPEAAGRSPSPMNLSGPQHSRSPSARALRDNGNKQASLLKRNPSPSFLSNRT